MKILRLTIKKRFFDMILAGDKKEEYREIKKYWEQRLFKNFPEPKTFDAIQFYNGAYYGDDLPNFIIEYKGVEIKKGKPEWGAEPFVDYFALQLGDVIK